MHVCDVLFNATAGHRSSLLLIEMYSIMFKTNAPNILSRNLFCFDITIFSVFLAFQNEMIDP